MNRHCLCPFRPVGLSCFPLDVSNDSTLQRVRQAPKMQFGGMHKLQRAGLCSLYTWQRAAIMIYYLA
jgi:hypothetical protein